MNKETIKTAKKEAKEFVKRCETLERLLGESKWVCGYPVAAGSLRRQSMELTRSLAQMRKP